MRILTLEDTAFDMNELPDEVDDLRFAVLDNSDPQNPDYFYIPLILAVLMIAGLVHLVLIHSAVIVQITCLLILLICIQM